MVLGLISNIIGYLVRSAGQHIPDQLAGLCNRDPLFGTNTPEDLPAIYSNAKYACRIFATMLISTWSSDTTALENIKWLDF